MFRRDNEFYHIYSPNHLHTAFCVPPQHTIFLHTHPPTIGVGDLKDGDCDRGFLTLFLLRVRALRGSKIGKYMKQKKKRPKINYVGRQHTRFEKKKKKKKPRPVASGESGGGGFLIAIHIQTGKSLDRFALRFPKVNRSRPVHHMIQ